MDTPPTQDPTSILGAAVRTWRRRLGLPQTLLADLAGVGVAFVYDLERGKQTLRIDKVLAVLEALGLGLTVAPDDRPVRAELGGDPPEPDAGSAHDRGGAP